MPASAHSSSAFRRASPEAGFLRTASPARTPSTLRALDQQRDWCWASPMPPVKPTTRMPRAPGDAAHAVLEHLAADRIEHHVGAAAVGDALDGVAERFASVEHQMIGARASAPPRACPRWRPPRSRWRRASCPSRPRQGQRRRRRRAPAALRRAASWPRSISA